MTELNKAASLTGSFNQTIGQWIGWLSDYTLEMLLQKPAPTLWSLGQVYVHIVDDTTYFVEQVELCLATNDNCNENMHPNARAMLAKNAFPDMLIEGPPSNLNVRQPQSKEDLLHSLLLIKEKVTRLGSAMGSTTSAGKTRHPGLLFFNAPEWLQFAEMHMRHHYRQKQRIDDVLFAAKKSC